MIGPFKKMLVCKIFQNTVIVVNHRIGAFASVQVVLQAFGHREYIVGVVRFDQMFPFAVGADEFDGDVLVAGDAVDGGEVFRYVAFFHTSGQFHFDNVHGSVPFLQFGFFECVFDFLDIKSGHEGQRFDQVMSDFVEAANVAPIYCVWFFGHFAFEESQQIGDVGFGVFVCGFYVVCCHGFVSFFFDFAGPTQAGLFIFRGRYCLAPMLGASGTIQVNPALYFSFLFLFFPAGPPTGGLGNKKTGAERNWLPVSQPNRSAPAIMTGILLTAYLYHRRRLAAQM